MKMNKSLRNGIFVIGAGVFCLLLGLSMTETAVKEESIKHLFLFAGLSVISLYVGLTGKKPSFGGGVVRKYASIGVGVLFLIYSIYLLIKVLFY